jgi:hypothetical protein
MLLRLESLQQVMRFQKMFDCGLKECFHESLLTLS